MISFVMGATQLFADYKKSSLLRIPLNVCLPKVLYFFSATYTLLRLTLSRPDRVIWTHGVALGLRCPVDEIQFPGRLDGQ